MVNGPFEPVYQLSAVLLTSHVAAGNPPSHPPAQVQPTACRETAADGSRLRVAGSRSQQGVRSVALQTNTRTVQ